jgi:hypothetical protein
VRLNQALIKLPVRFSAETLAAEVRALPADAWVPHPQNFEGNEYVPLVTPAGLNTNEFAGPMGITPFLRSCPYLMEVMAALDCVWGRSRLMGLGPGGAVPEHVDTNYYWRTHVRVHVPIITNPQVDFTCGGTTVQMDAGDCWVLDTFRRHHVENRGDGQRVHLVLDTVGGERLWDLVEAASQEPAPEPVLLVPGRLAGVPLRIEQHNYPLVMSPWEMRGHFDELLSLAADVPALEPVGKRLERLVAAWTAAWTQYADDAAGLPTYRALVAAVKLDLNHIPGGSRILLSNQLALYRVLQDFVFENALESDRVRESRAKALRSGERLAS